MKRRQYIFDWKDLKILKEKVKVAEEFTSSNAEYLRILWRSAEKALYKKILKSWRNSQTFRKSLRRCSRRVRIFKEMRNIWESYEGQRKKLCLKKFENLEGKSQTFRKSLKKSAAEDFTSLRDAEFWDVKFKGKIFEKIWKSWRKKSNLSKIFKKVQQKSSHL